MSVDVGCLRNVFVWCIYYGVSCSILAVWPLSDYVSSCLTIVYPVLSLLPSLFPTMSLPVLPLVCLSSDSLVVWLIWRRDVCRHEPSTAPAAESYLGFNYIISRSFLCGGDVGAILQQTTSSVARSKHVLLTSSLTPNTLCDRPHSLYVVTLSALFVSMGTQFLVSAYIFSGLSLYLFCCLTFLICFFEFVMVVMCNGVCM